jgi:predicted enzyme related to lactoylglutathione lyase
MIPGVRCCLVGTGIATKGEAVASPFVWFDLRTPARDAAERFYSSLLGWQIADNGGMAAGGEPWGAVAEDPDLQHARWLPYIQVEDLEEATQRAVELGATVVQAKTQGPAGFFTTISDPGGAQVALWQAPDATAASEE